MNNKMRKEFTFNDKVIFNLPEIFLIGFISGSITFFLLLEIIPVNKIILSGFLSLVLMQLILLLFKKKIVIEFSNTKTIMIQINKKTYHYSYDDIAGIYTYNYLTNPRISHVSMKIVFKDGKDIEINDIKFTSYKFDKKIYSELKDFILTLQEELKFRPISKSKTRSFWRAGAVYFSRK